jgi:hypothetical protein
MARDDSFDIFSPDPFGRDIIYGLSTGQEGLGLQPPPQGLPVDTRPYDRMQATPRGFISGLFSDVLGGTFNMPQMPRTGIPAVDVFSPNMNLFNRLAFGDVQKTAERISYGEPLTTGQGMTLKPREETIGAALTVAPFAPVAGRVAGRMIKATEGMPVGMGIKDVGKGITSNISQFTGFKNTTPYGKAKEVAAYLDRLNIPYTINKSKTTNSAYLEIQTGKGDFDYPMQFRFSDHSTDLPHQNRQIFTNPKPDPNFDLDVFKDGGHDTEFAVNKINELAAKINPITTNPKSPYPQQAALPTQYPLAPAGTRYEEFGGDLTYMTPDEFLQQVRPLQLDAESLDNIAALRSHVESGGKLDPLHIYASGKEDGRHRAYLAKELGIEKVPVALHGQTPTPIESPTFTDPFGNTIGSSIR